MFVEEIIDKNEQMTMNIVDIQYDEDYHLFTMKFDEEDYLQLMDGNTMFENKLFNWFAEKNIVTRGEATFDHFWNTITYHFDEKSLQNVLDNVNEHEWKGYQITLLLLRGGRVTLDKITAFVKKQKIRLILYSLVAKNQIKIVEDQVIYIES